MINKLQKSLSLILGLVLVLHASPNLASDTSDVKQMWDRSEMPVLFYLGKSELPINNSSTLVANNLLLKVVGSHWNNDEVIKSVITDPNKDDRLYRFAASLQCIKGDSDDASTGCQVVTGGGDKSNSLNEIHFNYWFFDSNDKPGSIAKARVLSSGFLKICTATQDCDYAPISEADIFYRDVAEGWFTRNYIESCDTDNWKAHLIDETLLHELGHALGLDDIDDYTRLMGGDDGSCFPNHPDYISEADWIALRGIYGDQQTTSVSISSPVNGSNLFAGQFSDFVAYSPSASSQYQLQSTASGGSVKSGGTGGTTDINWFSDLDGPIGTGSSISVSDLSPGNHFVTAQVGEPGDNLYGMDVVSVNVVEQYYTEDADYFHPLPCVRHADYSNEKCLIKFTGYAHYTQCLPLGYYATLDVLDLNNNTQVTEVFHNRTLGLGFCEDNQTENFSWYFWLDANDVDSKVRATFKLYNQGHCSYQSSLCQTGVYTALVHIVDATIDLEPIDSQCSIRPGETHCSVNLQWSKHFWAPDSAVFYKPLGTQNWIHLQDLGVSAGEIDLPPFVDELGAELAIFQYKNDISTLVNAKTGQLAGPFIVYGRRDIDPLFLGEDVFSFTTSQDVEQDSWNVLDNGTTLNLYGNTWKAIDYDYTTTANTWLKFDYKSEGEDSPEIAAVALLRYNKLSGGDSSSTFQVDGTQTSYGNQWFHRYFDNGWKTFDLNVGHVIPGRNIEYMGFIGDIDSPNKQIDISYHNPVLYEKPTTHTPEWGHSGNWYDPETNGQGIALEVNPINEMVLIEWFTYAQNGNGQGASYNRWYLQTGDYDPNGNSSSVILDIYQNTGGRFNRPDHVTEKVIGSATLRVFDCRTAHLEYDFDTGYNSGRHGYIPLKRITPNIDCSIDEYTGPHKSDFGYTGNWYNPPTSGQGFAFEVNPQAGAIVAQWFTYLPGASTNLHNPNRMRWFTIVGPYTPGSPSTNSLTIYQNTGGSLDDPNASTETAVGTAHITFYSCTSARIYYDFTGADEFDGLSGSIALERITNNVTCE